MPMLLSAPSPAAGAGFSLRSCCVSLGALHRAKSFVFGTLADITICAQDAGLANHVAAAVFKEFDRLHWMLHAWKESDLLALNRAIARGARGIPVTPELAQLIVNAGAFSESSGGLFNPAIGRLVELWNFHASEFLPAIPDPTALRCMLMANARMSDIKVENNAVICSNRFVQLDFGGYAKGYALDRAADFLRQYELTGALINIGGNIMALGQRGTRPWRVGIQHPRRPGLIAVLSLYDGEAISTSGDYERYFVLDGRRYSHLIDPRTGWPARGIQSATVLVRRGACSGTRSDASSGPLFIHGVAGWQGTAARLGVENAMLIDERGDVHLTDAMKHRLEFSSGALVESQTFR